MFTKFCDGSKIGQEFLKKYKQHKRGLFIMAPSGTGKTYYVNNQGGSDWIDGDEIWMATGAQPDRPWWTEGDEVIRHIDQRCDITTEECRKLGFWIIGASNNWLIPDASVIPDLRIQKKYIRKREETNYDGGATSEDFAQVVSHRKEILRHAKKHSVPVFKTIEEAVAFLRKKYKM